MQINNNSRLKWPAGPAQDGRNEACDCEDDKTVVKFQMYIKSFFGNKKEHFKT